MQQAQQLEPGRVLYFCFDTFHSLHLWNGRLDRRSIFAAHAKAHSELRVSPTSDSKKLRRRREFFAI
jgi:hypothetical protein